MTPTESSPETGNPTEREIAAELRLRPDPPRVMRLSRRAIALLSGAGLLGLGAILIVALQEGRVAEDAPELISTDRVQAADGLAELPRDYGDVPRLGPPLPGELGRAIVDAQERGVPVAPPPAAGPIAPPGDPDAQLRLQEAEAARLSALFAEANTVGGQAASGASASPALTPAGPIFADAAQATGPVPAGDDLFAGTGIGETENPARLADPSSPYVLLAGTVIPAALVTGLRSDLPGQVTAQVTAHVYDSPSGRYLLIPQGSRLVGIYDSDVAAGQRRVLLAWTRLILPSGRAIALGQEPGADAAGFAGLEDRVDNHWRRVALAAGLATILNIGLETRGSDDEVAEAIRDGTQETVGRTADAIVERQLAIPPTLTIRPGVPVHVVVTRDLVLEPLGVLP